ncbi:hypothetical protein [Campylobacter concisus]|jgi:conserved LPS biosynthetic protein|uniref:hypothetical protein n=1 Tax=Campylobacter concisus TaxID=199 RepID=UPI0006628ECD|nr:hypothetical protein [Campylobacter concisus]VTX99066.1 Uncharacterised protein [Campylobacter concisus]
MFASLVYSIFETRLPGTGCTYILQNIHFLKLVYTFDVVGLIVKVVGADQIKRRDFGISCFVKNIMVINGEAKKYSIKINKVKGT